MVSGSSDRGLGVSGLKLKLAVQGLGFCDICNGSWFVREGSWGSNVFVFIAHYSSSSLCR